MDVHRASAFKKRRPLLRIAFQPLPQTQPASQLPSTSKPLTPLNYRTVMNFHTDVTTFYLCGEDQTVAWSSEHSNYEHAALAFDCAAADPIAVSVDLLRDMKKLFNLRSRKTPVGCFPVLSTTCPTLMSGLGRSEISRRLVPGCSILAPANLSISRTTTITRTL
jgi:hypothetical protein